MKCRNLRAGGRGSGFRHRAENLDRATVSERQSETLADLTKLERDELLAEWIKLTEKGDDKPSQLETVSAKGGRGNEGGINAAARDLGVSKADAHRAVKVGALSQEAKDAAREVGLDDMPNCNAETTPACMRHFGARRCAGSTRRLPWTTTDRASR